MQRLGGGGSFFHQRGILLRGLVHLRDGFADLRDRLERAQDPGSERARKRRDRKKGGANHGKRPNA